MGVGGTMGGRGNWELVCKIRFFINNNKCLVSVAMELFKLKGENDFTFKTQTVRSPFLL